jgi:hypothetical protein
VFTNSGQVAEAEGFEPPVPFGTFAFKANALGRSATLPLTSVATARGDISGGRQLPLRSRRANRRRGRGWAGRGGGWATRVSAQRRCRAHGDRGRAGAPIPRRPRSLCIGNEKVAVWVRRGPPERTSIGSPCQLGGDGRPPWHAELSISAWKAGARPARRIRSARRELRIGDCRISTGSLDRTAPRSPTTSGHRSLLIIGLGEVPGQRAQTRNLLSAAMSGFRIIRGSCVRTAGKRSRPVLRPEGPPSGSGRSAAPSRYCRLCCRHYPG